MHKANLGDILHFVRRRVLEHDTRSDAALLHRFALTREDAAFSVLVERHARMVMAVCRRILGDHHAAEDAFQAVYVVLARRAASLRLRKPLGAWLHVVAQRVALRALAKTQARLKHERRWQPMAQADRLDECTWQELRAILDEEIGRLAEKYRTPIVLCHLEEKSQEQAAQELGWAKGTLARRLERGREILRKQLTKRGVTVSVAALSAALCEKAAGKPVAALLTLNTVKGALSIDGGKAVAAGYLSATALGLAEEAMVGMLLAKGKLIAIVVTLTLAIGGASWAGYTAIAEPGQAARSDQESKPEAQAKEQEKENLAGAAGLDKQARVDAYGDPLPEGAAARLGTVRFRHDGRNSALMFTPDGKGVVGLSLSGVVIWDHATGKERIRLPVPDAHSRGMDISPDGSTLVIAEDPYQDGRISYWNLHTGEKVRSVTFPKEFGMLAKFNHLRFSPDGKTLACNSRDGKTVIINLASNTVSSIIGRESQVFYNQAFSSDGKSLLIAVHSDDALAGNSFHEIQLWDTASAKHIRTIVNLGEMTYKTLVRTIAFTGDSKRLHYGTSERCCLVDLATGKKLSDFKASWHQVLTPDGTKLVTWNGSKTEVRDVQTGSIVHTFNKTETVGGSMALSPDGTTVAHGSSGSSVRLWDVATGEERFSELEGHHSAIRKLAFSADGKKLFSCASNGGIFVWDTSSHERIANFPIWVRTMAASPDGTLIATSDVDFGQRPGKVRFWNVSTGKEVLTLDFPNTDLIDSLNYSRDGRLLYTLDFEMPARDGIPGNSSVNMSIRHWNVATGKQERMWSLRGPPLLPLAPDGKTIIIPEQDGAIVIRNAETGGTRTLRGQDGRIMALSVSPDGRLLATGLHGANAAIRLWELASGKEILVLKLLDDSSPAVAWSPDGRMIASATATSKGSTVGLWDTATGKTLVKFEGFKSSVSTGSYSMPLIFSPDGKTLAVGLTDSSILLWDTAKHHPRLAPAPTLGKDKLESCWSDLSNDDGGPAHQALWELVGSPKQSIPYFRNRLNPIAITDAATIKRWITDLASDKFPVRQAAAKELEKVGEQVTALIQKAMKGEISLETSRRLEQILSTLSDVPAPETLRTIRAIMALERIGSPEAQAVLETLAKGAPGARETEEAKGSLGRLRPAQ